MNCFSGPLINARLELRAQSTAQAMQARLSKDGAEDLKSVMKSYKPLMNLKELSCVPTFLVLNIQDLQVEFPKNESGVLSHILQQWTTPMYDHLHLDKF